MDEILEYELNQSQRYLHPLSIIFLDIDEFRKINDTHGYQTGDLILKMIARLIQNNSRAADTVGRWGGDRFLLICPETRLEGAKVLARKLLEIIANSYFPKAGSSTASAGLAEYRKDDSQWQLLETSGESTPCCKEERQEPAVELSAVLVSYAPTPFVYLVPLSCQRPAERLHNMSV